MLLEERKVDDHDVEEQEAEGEEEVRAEAEAKGIQTRKRRVKVWDEKIPMLNGSVKRAGFESEEGGWSGRTIEVGRVLARWFKFGRID